MEITPTLICIILSLFPLFYVIIQPLFSKPKSTISGFKKHPIFGTIPDLLTNRHRLLEWSTSILSSLSTHTAPFYRLVGGTHGIMTADPNNVEHILKTRFDNYPKGPRFYSNLHDFLGNGIFNADGALWQLQRKTASFAFSMRTLRNFLLNSVQTEIITRLNPILEEACVSNRVLDLQDVLERFSFDNVCKFAFNVDLGCLSQTGSNESEFMRAFNEATELCSGRFLYAHPILWKIKRFFNYGSEKRLKEVSNYVHEFADKIIRLRLEEMETNKQNNYDDLLSRFLVNTIEEKNHGSNSSATKFLKDVVVSVILAGKDTTSTGLSWLFWLLSINPNVVEKIRYEIHQIRVRSKKRVGGTYDYEELQEMHYLHAVISESLRLYPPIPIDTKACLEDDILPDGTKVKGGWFVLYHIYAMGRMEDIWGKDCFEFKPERWLENEIYKTPSYFKYPIFHAGPRICLGKEMAYIQMKSIVANLVEQYDLDVLGKERRPNYVLSLTLRMENGLHVRLKKR